MTTSKVARALAARAHRPAPSTAAVPSAYAILGDALAAPPIEVQDGNGEARVPVRPASRNRSAVTEIGLPTVADDTGRATGATPLRLAAPPPSASTERPHSAARETRPVATALPDTGRGRPPSTPTSTAPWASADPGPALPAVPMNPAFAGIPTTWQPELAPVSPAVAPPVLPPARLPKARESVTRPDFRGDSGQERASVTATPATAPARPSVTIGEIHVHTRESRPAPDPLALLAPYANGLTARRDDRR